MNMAAQLGRPRAEHVCVYCQMAIALYQQGLGLISVAGRVGIQPHTVVTILKHHSVPRRTAGRPPGYKDPLWTARAVALHGEGKNCREIGVLVGVTRERVRQVLTLKGVKPARNHIEGHRCDGLCTWLLAQPQPVALSLEIARAQGVVYDRLKSRATAHGLPWKAVGQPRHRCDERCERMREGLAAGLSIRAAGKIAYNTVNRPMIYTHLRLQHPEFNWPEGAWWESRRFAPHSPPHFPIRRHQCSDRCATFRDRLASGASIYAASMSAGVPSSTGYQDYPRYHPDWPWPEKRQSPQP